MAADKAAEEFITIVPVGETRSLEQDPAFVTVLTVGAAAGAAEVLVRRPRGARLGLGLKFEGGSAAAEKVRRLLVQSCAPDSPAANAITPWDKLIPGDEILAIDGSPVSDLTRIDCVRRLKDSDEALKLLVRHLEGEELKKSETETTESSSGKPQAEIQRPTCMPPPVPPRKLHKKNSFKDRTTLFSELNVNGKDLSNGIPTEQAGSPINARTLDLSKSFVNKLSRKSSFDSHIHRQAKESIAAFKNSSPEEVRRLVRRLSDGKAIPPEAEVYIDLLSQEWERCLALADAESDDTGSSISTVVDRLGSMTSSVENSIPSTPTMQQKTIDIQRVLNCIENIDSDLLKDIASTRFMEKSSDISLEARPNERPVPRHARGSDEIDSFLSSSTAEETIAHKKLSINDKNNNNTIIRNVTCINIDSSESRQVVDRPKPKIEAAVVKPKPMPRSMKPDKIVVEGKSSVEAMPSERVQSAESEDLLTPTKKNCIENWLQRSEAELTTKRRLDAFEEVSTPEALPRLIDFVPKPQFRGCESPQERVSTPKVEPPAVIVEPASVEPRVEQRMEACFQMTPPAESREDGSGASLDTIGELDEGTDTANTEESGGSDANVNKCKQFESTFWKGRTNRNDAEDIKCLSNDETPPTCPRQPPDGVETPNDAVEKAPEPLRAEPPSTILPSSTSATLRLPPRLPAPVCWSAGRGRTRTSYSRSQDARSECSVKDKIAMFSNDRATSIERIDKCGVPTSVRHSSTLARHPIATYKSSFSEVQTLDRRLTKSHENLDEVPRVDRSYRHVDKRPEVLGALNIPRTYTDNKPGINKTRYSDFASTPFHYGSSTNLVTPKQPQHSESVYHTRSISNDSASSESSHKSTLEYLIEQRKKSMSKLRGLMIPEIQAPIPDLPEIKVQENNPAKSTTYYSKNQSKDVTDSRKNSKAPINFKDSWNINLDSNNIPKYSPAFKRKSLQVYTASGLSKESTPERKLEFPLDTRLSYPVELMNNKSVPMKPPRTSIDNKKIYDRTTSTLPSKVSLSSALKLAGRNDKSVYEKYRDFGNVEVKICTTTDIVDSDNDSAVSSTQSSYRSSASSPLHSMDNLESDSSHLSSRPMAYSLVKTEIPNKTNGLSKLAPEYEKTIVYRSVSSDTNASISSSAGSAATSGSQASCSSLESSVPDSGKKKVSKTHSVDTINRRNILASAKCRSGKDLKVSSPVIETKFSHESPDRSPSPQRIPSDRLTTLTSNVSVLSSKGESRRTRSKVIADTDSDSESERNLRQRKSEFKNTRLKKNSNSQSTKTDLTRKQTECTIIDNAGTVEEIPQTISEIIIKEISKAGLHDIAFQNVEKKNDISPNENTQPKTREDILLGSTKTPVNVLPKKLIEKSAKVIYPIQKADQSDIKSVVKNNKEGKVDDISCGSYNVCLKKGGGAGVGLILAGGIDCEAKIVTVHKVLAGSVAERQGLQRGVRVLSVNGRSMDGLTHAETVAVLKENRPEVDIEIENEIRESVSSVECGSDMAESKESAPCAHALVTDAAAASAESAPVSVVLDKTGAGAGLGFGLEGGKDSPSGDRPLTIKKLFAGGAAARAGRVVVGAQLVSAGGRDMRGLTRTQAWAALKELPEGPVTLILKNPC